MASIFVPIGVEGESRSGFVRFQREAATRTDAAAMLKANVETDVRDLLPQVQAPHACHPQRNGQGRSRSNTRADLAATIPNASAARSTRATMRPSMRTTGSSS